MGGKKAGNNFSRNAQIVRTKIVGKKTVGEKCEKAFFIFERIPCSKMGGEKRAKQFFHKHWNSATKKWGKNRLKKVRNSVFYIRTNIVPKKRGERNLRNNCFRNTRIV